MGIRRSNDPLTWGDLDGIILNETAPASNVAGVAANVAILVGRSQRGPSELTQLTSITMVHEMFGKDKTKGLNKVLKNKKFGSLKFIRAVAADAVKASKIFKATAVDIIKFEAKYTGVYGNNIKVVIEAGTVQGKKYTISDTNPDAVLKPEVYDNVLVAGIASANPFAKSMLVKVTVVATSAEPDNVAATSLAAGAEGTVGNTEYETAIAKAMVAGSGNLLFSDLYNSTINGYIKTHAAASNDKMVTVEGDPDDEWDDVVTKAANLRDTDGRVVLCFNPVITNIDDEEVEQPAAWWIASAFSQCAPHIDLAFHENSQYFAGAVRLKYALGDTEYTALNKAGVCALEFDPDIGHKVKSAVTTQILNTEKQTILRRRMTDFYQDSLAKFLKNYSNGVNSAEKRKLCKAGIVRFDDMLIDAKVLPGDSELSGGAKARLIDTDSLNTNDSIGEGFFKILIRRRIFSSMRYIVLSTEIGTGVVVVKEA